MRDSLWRVRAEIRRHQCHRSPKCGHGGTLENRPLRVGVHGAFFREVTREEAHGQLPEDEATSTSSRPS